MFLACFAAVPIAFLLGILRIRLARSSVSELVVALEAGEPLRGALAGALGDPGLDIVYWLDWRRGLGGAGWVDPQGQSVPEPTATESRSVKLVTRKGERVAAIVYDRELDGEPELVEAVTAAASLALQNDRLQAELRAEVSFISTVTNTAPSLLVNIGTDGRIRNINAAALEVAGIADEEAARGRALLGALHRPAGARRDDCPLPRPRARLSGRRVREHVHERARRGTHHLLARRTHARHLGPGAQHHLGRPRHHRAAQTRARARARTRRDHDDARVNPQHRGRTRPKRDDS